jgi:hypothetical protein
MKPIIILLFILFVIDNQVFAQNRNLTYTDFSVAVGEAVSPALSINKVWGLGKKGKFKIGSGLRVTYLYTGNQMPYITAPAKIINGQVGPQVFFKEYIPEKLDTLLVSKTSIGYLNIPIHLQYSFSKKFDIGFNIDAIGLTFGGKQAGKFKASGSAVLNNTTQNAKPTLFNALLVSNNDLGSLNSELYARYWVNNKLGVRAGLSFQFAEFTTTNKLTDNNDRFRYKYWLPMVGLSYKI